MRDFTQIVGNLKFVVPWSPWWCPSNYPTPFTKEEENLGKIKREPKGFPDRPHCNLT